MNTIVTVLYYLLTAYVAVLLVANFLKDRKWQDEVLYIIVLIPFVLRLLRLKRRGRSPLQRSGRLWPSSPG